MSYINFDKKQLINLEYSLGKELIRSNRAGAYASKTIAGCHTRKYHGLLVVPQPTLDDDNHVLLSNLDETIIQRNAEFNLGIHKYPGGIYSPKGHKYHESFSADPIPNSIYHVGGVILKKETLFAEKEDRILIRYTLIDSHSPTKLKFWPYLAFRNVHKLTRANVEANKRYKNIRNGIRMRLYPGYSPLYMQFSKEAEYTHVPDWHYSIEYQEEMERGYEYQEDLMVPGFFEVPIRKGETIIFAAGTSEADPAGLKRMFTNEINKRVPRDNFENCLVNSAQQFIVRRGKRTEVIAGFPWFGRWGRDTFISLPGITLVIGDEKTFRAVINTMIKEMNGPFFPNMGMKNHPSYDSVDSSLWFIWALQQYAIITGKKSSIWRDYKGAMLKILNGFRSGEYPIIRMMDNGLLYAGEPGKAVTWMDAVVDGKPVTPRTGSQVEINALWYNAIMFTLELASLAKDTKVTSSWLPVANLFPPAFKETFWLADKGYLADYVDGERRDIAVRPNMIIATSLPYTAVDEEKRNQIMEVVRRELLTPRGLRSLAPKNPMYKGECVGDQVSRDESYHQGTVWPWLLGHFAEGYLKIHGRNAVPYINQLFKGFEPEMWEHGIGTISEIYDGDPPHKPRGAVSQAWSVGELLRIHWLMQQYLKEK
jgi:predicted glycogen debranching enzyme